MSNKFVCIKCPIGCTLEVDNEKITGARCPKGITFAKQELTLKLRSYTSSVKTNFNNVFVPVKATNYVPLKEFKNITKIINEIKVKLPIKMGDIIIENILNLGIDIIATRTITEDYNEYYK